MAKCEGSRTSESQPDGPDTAVAVGTPRCGVRGAWRAPGYWDVLSACPASRTSQRDVPTYSARNATIGSTRAARRAGIQQAKSATPNNTNATPPNVIGSVALPP